MTNSSMNDWSTTPALNTDIFGTDIDVGCAPQDVGVFMRSVLAQIAYAVQGTGGPIPATWHVGTLTATTISATTISAPAGNLSLASLTTSGNVSVGAQLNVAGDIAQGGVTLPQFRAGISATDGSGTVTVNFAAITAPSKGFIATSAGPLNVAIRYTNITTTTADVATTDSTTGNPVAVTFSFIAFGV